METREDHLLLCADFFPLIGGAHTWMYEVYKRWPQKVTVWAGDYADDPELEGMQERFDAACHGALSIERHAMDFGDLSLLNGQCLRQYGGMLSRMHRRFKGRTVTIHVLRAFPEGIAAALYKRMFNRSCTLLTYVHGEELNVAATSRQLSLFTRWVLGVSDIIIANSRATRDKTQAFRPGIKAPCVIHPGVEWAAYQEGAAYRSEQREKWGCRDGEVVLVTVARLEPRKNHHTVMAAVAELIKAGMGLRYVIAGDGGQRRSLEELSRRLDIADQVVFTGVIDNAEKRLSFAAADIHVMPSVTAGAMVEGFGIVFMEAAAAGLPSIAGNSGGQPEAVLDGVTGFNVDGTGMDEVKDAIARLAQDPNLRRQMGAAGKKWAQEHDWEQIARKTVATVLENSHAL